MIAPRIAWLACLFQDQVILGSSSQVIADGKPGLSPADYDRVRGDGYGFAHNATPCRGEAWRHAPSNGASSVNATVRIGRD